MNLTCLLQAGTEVLPLGERFAKSGEMMLRGMGTVFMVLILLWAIFAGIGKIFAVRDQKKKTEKIAAEKIAEEETPVASPTAAEADDGALVAAITAAICAYRAEEGKAALPFRVVSFQRKKNTTGWQRDEL